MKVVGGIGYPVGHVVSYQGVHLAIFESGVRGRDPPDEEVTKTVISRDEWYLRVGLSLFGHGRMRTASAGKITK